MFGRTTTLPLSCRDRPRRRGTELVVGQSVGRVPIVCSTDRRAAAMAAGSAPANGCMIQSDGNRSVSRRSRPAA